MGSFLVEHLDYSWNEVHDDAEVLEHVTSEHLADHLENYLNHPEHCPHGGSIPKKEEVVHEERRQTLESYPVGTKCVSHECLMKRIVGLLSHY